MNREIKYTRQFIILYVLGISILFGASFIYNISKENQTAFGLAKSEANASFHKDMLYRRWASMHGGVYVPITDTTPPNKYLTYIKEREIVTPSGRKLTLVNPAYMTRQVFELTEEEYGVKGHITSLNPIRPENKADEWETLALKEFEKGAKEYFGMKPMNGKQYLRYMHAMPVEKNCLKCHAHQGYQLGEIRGGISVSVPMDKYYVILNSKIQGLVFTHISIYIICILFGIFAYRRLLGELNKREKAQQAILISESNLKKQNYEFQALNEEYKTQNEELHKAKLKAEESESLKTAFLQNMSHEIRTPMNAIMGFSGLLQKPGVSDEKRNGFINIIKNSSSQLLSIVTDILTISSIDTRQVKLNNEPTGLNKLLNELEAIFKSQSIKQKITIRLNQGITDIDPEIEVDKTKLVQVLSNLLTNAIKFTHEGSVEFGYKIIGSEIQFYVKDTGIGISDDQKELIFERFRQADISISKKYGGTGLGLSISKAFVELMGGKIWVESIPGKGSTFFFTIPYLPVNRSQNPNLAEGIQKQGNIVLIAEDEDYNFLFVEEIINEMGLIPIRAKNGQEAIDLCMANQDIALVLMDIKMPVMNGYEASLKIKKIKPHLPIIAQTAYALEHEKSKYGSTSFADYLTKPLDEQELKNNVLKHLNLKQKG